MKSMIGHLLGRLHILIFIYAAYATWEAWDANQIKVQEVEAQVPPIENDIVRHKKKLKDIDSYRKDVENSRKRVEEVFRSIEKVQRQLPVEVNDIEVLDYLAKEGRLLNITTLEPSPMTEEPEGFYVLKPYRIKGRGTFLQFAIFIERLAQAERLFNVKKLQLISSSEPQKGRFHMLDMDAVVETFRYNVDHKEKSGIEEIEAQFKAGGESGGSPRKRKRAKARDGGDE